MIATADDFTQWLTQARVHELRLTAEQRGLLHAAFSFRQRCGDDYYSNRLLSHFLLHANTGLQVAQIARLVGFSRPNTSKQQGLSSKEAIQAAHHRLAGRPHGKLLPRFAGPVAEFLLSHPDATRYDVLDFIERTWSVRVSTVALHHFCKKFGLDRASRAAARAPTPSPTQSPTPPETPTPTAANTPDEPPRIAWMPPEPAIPLSPPPFCPHAPSTPVPFS
jgi:hypothetical protein